MSTQEQKEEYIDIDGGLQRLRGNKALYTRMLNMFIVTESPGEFEAAVKVRDDKAAAAAVHTLKGVAGNLSLTKLHNDSAALLAVLREGVFDDGMICEYTNTLRATMKYVTETIEELK